MRMYTKDQITLTANGYLMAPDGNILTIDRNIIEQANCLETLAQKFAYLSAQPEATPMPTLDGFERKSTFDFVPKFAVTTPTLDRKAKEALALMEEIDNVGTAKVANEALECFAELFEFVRLDQVIDLGDPAQLVRIDTPTLGNILELTTEDVIDVVAHVSGLEKREEDEPGFVDKDIIRELLDMLDSDDEDNEDDEDDESEDDQD